MNNKSFILYIFIISVLFSAALYAGVPEEYQKGRELYLKKNYPAALDIFHSILRENQGDAIDSGTKEKLFFSIGKIYYFYIEDYPEALTSFNQLATEFPGSNLTDDALYYAAKLLLKKGERKAAEKKLDIILTAHKNSDFYSKALTLLEKIDRRNAGPVQEKTGLEYKVKEEPLISLDFKDFPLRDFIMKVSELTGTNYILPDNLNGKVSLLSPRKVPVSEIKNVLEYLLNLKGFAAVQVGNFVRIERLNNGLTDSMDISRGEDIEYSTNELTAHFIEIKYGHTSEIAGLIRQLLPPPTKVTIDMANSCLIVVGYKTAIEKALNLISELDIDVIEPVFQIYRLKYTSAAGITGNITNLLSSRISMLGKKNQTRIIPEHRLNALIVLSPKDMLPFIEDLIYEFDVEQPIQAHVKLFKLHHLDPAEAIKQIQNLLQASFQSSAAEVKQTKLLPENRQNAVFVATPVPGIFTLIDQYLKEADVEIELEKPLIKIFPLVNADEDQAKQYIIDILSAEGQSYQNMLKNTRVIPDKRLNALIVSTKYPQVITDIQNILKQLDKEVDIRKSNLHIYHLQNAGAKNVAEVLAKLTIIDPKSPKNRKPITITFDESTNAVVVTSTPEEYLHIKRLIKEFDIPKQQVLIHVLIAEVTFDQTESMGIEWLGGGDIKNSAYSAGVSQNFGMAASSFTSDNNPKDAAKGLLGLSVGIIKDDGADVAGIINANRTNANFNILNTPTIVTENHHEALIDVGERVPYITYARITDQNTTIHSYDYQMVGITLKITPHINNSKIITLDISQSVKDLLEKVVLDQPLTSSREIQTRVSIEHGKTVVIGGLIKSKKSNAKRSVPFISSMPLVGNLFKRKDSRMEKTNLIVVITPKIIEDSSKIALPEKKSSYFKKRLKETDYDKMLNND